MAPAEDPPTPQWIVTTKHTLMWVGDHLMLVAALTLTAAIAYNLALWQWRRRRRNSKKTRQGTAERKLAAALHNKVGYTAKQPPKRNWITWPRDPHATGATVKILYAASWMPTPRDETTIAGYLAGMVGGEWAPNHDHMRDTLRFIRQAPPPAAEVLPTLAAYVDDPAAPVDRVPFAVKVTGQLETADLTHLTPHVLVSASTGWGKTSIVAVFVAHIAGRGGLVDICDPKRIGYSTFTGLPNVNIHTNVNAMTAAIAQVRADMEHRYKQAEETKADLADRERFPLRLLVLDEMGSLVQMVKTEWAELRDPNGPVQAPTFADIMVILWQGRAAGIHVITAAQQANAAVLINSDARDQYALKIAAGPQSSGAWKMMFGTESQVAPDPVKGRAIIGVGPDLLTAQLVTIDPADARRIASRGWLTHSDWAGRWQSGNSPVIPPDAGNPRPVPPDIDTFFDDPGPESPAAAELPDELQAVPNDAQTVRPARRGRPPAQARPEQAVACGDGHEFRSRARPGQYVKCPVSGCVRTGRVPG